MTPSHRKALVDCSKLIDIVILFSGLEIVYPVFLEKNPWRAAFSLDVHHPVRGFLATVALGVTWHVMLSKAGLYKSRRLVRLSSQVIETVQGVVACTALVPVWLVIVCAQPARQPIACVEVTLLFGLLALSVLGTTRILSGLVTHAMRKRGRNLRHVIVVGSNRRATSFAESLKASAGWGYHLQGFVDDRWCDEEMSPAYGEKLLGSFSQFPELLRTMAVDEVIIALPIASFYDQIAQVLQLCKHHGLLVRFTGTLFDSSHSRGRQGADIPLSTISLHDESWDAWASLFKRLVDLSISGFLIVALSPVLGLVSLLIKLTSPGPILFVQTRLGLGKRPFRIYKFRTMVADAETLMKSIEHLNEMGGPTFKLKNDPRITRVGRFLRKTSLDELPQLFNVLFGDMSLVGPRPLPLRDYDGFSHDWHRRRFCVKPGITCLWQVMGRSSITFDEWMALDMQYIDHWSMWLDMLILAKTIPAVLRGSGAV